MYTLEQLTKIANDTITVTYRGFGKRSDNEDWEGFNYTYTHAAGAGTYTKGIRHALYSPQFAKPRGGLVCITDDEVKRKCIHRRMTLWDYERISYWIPVTTPIEVLTSLISDAQCVEYNTYEDFCCSYGYDTDSIKALKLYHELQGTLNALRKLGINVSNAWDVLSNEGLV